MKWPKEVSIEGFHEKCKKHYKNGELAPVAIDAQYALDLIYKELIDKKGEVPYITAWPCGNEQINSIMLSEILWKYSRKYRKFCKNLNKNKENQKIKENKGE